MQWKQIRGAGALVGKCLYGSILTFLLLGRPVALPAQPAQRLDQLFDRVSRTFLSLPIPKRPVCRPELPAAFQQGLDTVAFFREHGAADCALQLLDRLRQRGFRDETAQLFWLDELAQTLTRAEQMDSAIAVCGGMLELAERHTGLQGRIWLTAAQARHAKRQFGETQRLAEKALAFARKSGDQLLAAKALDVIGNVSRDIYMTRPDKSVSPLLEALEIARTLRDTNLMVRLLSSASLHYVDSDPEKALEYLEQAVAVLRPGTALRSRYSVLRCLSYVFQMKADYGRSNRLFESAIQIGKYLGLRSGVQNDYEQMSDNYVALGNANKAQACLDSAYRYCNFQRELGYFYRSFAEVAHMRGDLPAAYSWYQKAFDEQIKGYNNRNTQQLTEWETRFRTREKEIQLEEQRRQRWLLLGLILALAGLCTGAVIAYFQQKKSRQQLLEQHAIIEKQAAALRRLDESKSRFFANISHELRTPITLMFGPLQSMLDTGQLGDRNMLLAQTALQHSKRLLQLVNEILDLSKLESGMMQLRESAVYLQPFVRRLVDVFESHAAHLGIRLVLQDRLPEHLAVQLDMEKWQQVVQNLLSNALKFTGAGGSIEVGVEIVNAYIRLHVRDTGRGIHPDDLPFIFDRFYQTTQPMAPAEGGSGIGLALCREYAELMHGRIWVESVLGEGSCFYFEVPKKDASLVAERASGPGASSPGEMGDLAVYTPDDQSDLPENAERILLVEDNESMSAYVRMVLSERYEVIAASNGRRALEWLEAQTGPDYPQLILSDVMMPEMDGFQLLEALRNREPWRSIPVIMLTARAGASDRMFAFRMGIEDYIEKPFAPEELLVRVANALRNLEARGEWQAVAGTASALAAAPEAMANTWVEDLLGVIRAHIDDPRFNVDQLADLLGISRGVLYRQIRETTGLSANQLIQETRLQQARTLLEMRQFDNLRDVSHAVGFRTADYFSRLFRERFGKSPAEYF